MGKFSKKPQEVEVVTDPLVYANTPSKDDRPRVGTWVVTKEGVGILTGAYEVTLAKADGSIQMVIENDVAVPHKVVVDNPIRAYIEDIPVPRRPAAEVLFSLNYQHRP